MVHSVHKPFPGDMRIKETPHEGRNSNPTRGKQDRTEGDLSLMYIYFSAMARVS